MDSASDNTTFCRFRQKF